MSFQGYLNTIQAKTGKGPDDFRQLAEQKGFTKKGQLVSTVKAGDIVKWLKEEFQHIQRPVVNGCIQLVFFITA